MAAMHDARCHGIQTTPCEKSFGCRAQTNQHVGKDYAEASAMARESVRAIISHIITPCRKIRVRANLVVPLKLSSVVVSSEVKDAIK